MSMGIENKRPRSEPCKALAEESTRQREYRVKTLDWEVLDIGKSQKEAGHRNGMGDFRDLDPKTQILEALSVIMNLTFKNSNGKPLFNKWVLCMCESESICQGQKQ